MQKRWAIAAGSPAMAQSLAADLALPLPLAQVLVQRGFTTSAAASRFLDPQLRHLADPFELPGMAGAVDRLLQAIDQHQRIVIYGDYDVDGVTASALLAGVLQAANATVANFLPDRLTEGYGLSAPGIARCVAEHRPQLLLAVDCGTTAVAEIAGLAAQGIDVIVLDHHEPPAHLPACVALVNPKCAAQGSVDGTAALASVGVAFKLAHALLKRRPALQQRIDLRGQLDLVALGTVADVVPLVHENRLLVRAGLERLGRTSRTGLRALLELAEVPAVVTPYHVGFRLGPRLNAAGRLASATAALELLLTSDHECARRLARELHHLNAQRQRIEEQIVAAALAQASTLTDDQVLVVADPGWHTGVIGIVAARVLQQFHRPTVVIGADGKGSCRSINGFSMVAALQACAELLEQFGGHEMAAGLRVDPANLALFRQHINDYALQHLRPEDLVPQLTVEAVLQLGDLDDELFTGLERFEPCGTSNPAPVFAVGGVRLCAPPRLVGKGHLKFRVTDGADQVDAIWFGPGERGLPEGPVDIAFTAELNEFRGQSIPQLKVRDLRPAAI